MVDTGEEKEAWPLRAFTMRVARYMRLKSNVEVELDAGADVHRSAFGYKSSTSIYGHKEMLKDC
jgi:hypothetical protein